jgi:signal transduction histidine kinase
MGVAHVSLEQRSGWTGRHPVDVGDRTPRFVRAALRLPLWGKIAGANLAIVLFAGAVLYTQLPEAHSQLETTGVIALVVGLVANLALVRVALQPLRDLEATAGRVWRGELDARVEASAVADRDMMRVGGAINMLLDGLVSDRARSRRLASLVISAQDEERSRIARELHDSSAQSITAIVLQLSAAVRDERDPEMQARLEEIRVMAGDALEELRVLSHTVHPRVLDDLGLVAALEWLARRTRTASGVEVEVFAPDEAAPFPVPAAEASVLYRVAQEALNNAVRHAKAKSVLISVDTTPQRAALEIRDDGAGFDVEEAERRRPGMGLFSMRERVSLVNGCLEITSAVGAGTRVNASIPLSQQRQT